MHTFLPACSSIPTALTAALPQERIGALETAADETIAALEDEHASAQEALAAELRRTQEQNELQSEATRTATVGVVLHPCGFGTRTYQWWLCLY